MNLWGKLVSLWQKFNAPGKCHECGKQTVAADADLKSGGHWFCSLEHYDDYQAERVI